MTPLNRPVVRKTAYPYKHYRAPIVVKLQPGDYIVLRLARQRTEVSIPITHLFDELLYRKARAIRAGKRTGRKAVKTK
jgi:2-hydroxychromene-2-carboxylate isomerase